MYHWGVADNFPATAGMFHYRTSVGTHFPALAGVMPLGFCSRGFLLPQINHTNQKRNTMLATITYGAMRPILDDLFDNGVIADYEWADEPTDKLPYDIIHVTAHDGRVVSLFEDCLNPSAPIEWITYPSMNEVGTKYDTGRGETHTDDLAQFMTNWAS